MAKKRVSGTGMDRNSRSSSSDRSKATHVVPTQDGTWVVREDGAGRASKTFARERDAVDWARDKGKRNDSSVVIHRPDGTIRRKDTYGTDPSPRSKKR